MAFSPSKFIPGAVEDIKKSVGSDRCIIAVSGGVDSMVAAALAARAVPSQLACIFVDTGFMRKNETKNVEEAARKAGIPLKVVEESERFIKKLEGVSDPEQKRKIIGEQFIRVFEEAAKTRMNCSPIIFLF
ncbi:MAG TPA: phosphoadenosine phosphosulfate reductase family protein, partial [Candidatus Bilamarchaeaceae archaeon]|nr:phosphoadenosine phosphosulfate reductase family protein [Candidatus Bilamarchaeaceae archaeon]